MFKFKITLDRHNAGQKLNYCVHPDPPLFSLPSTFNVQNFMLEFNDVSIFAILFHLMQRTHVLAAKLSMPKYLKVVGND
jgi:hypothetical protein